MIETVHHVEACVGPEVAKESRKICLLRRLSQLLDLVVATIMRVPNRDDSVDRIIHASDTLNFSSSNNAMCLEAVDGFCNRPHQRVDSRWSVDIRILGDKLHVASLLVDAITSKKAFCRRAAFTDVLNLADHFSTVKFSVLGFCDVRVVVVAFGTAAVVVRHRLTILSFVY